MANKAPDPSHDDVRALTLRPLGSPTTGVGVLEVSELAGVAAPAGVDVAVRVEEGVRSGTRRDRHVGEGKLLRAAFDETG